MKEKVRLFALLLNVLVMSAFSAILTNARHDIDMYRSLGATPSIEMLQISVTAFEGLVVSLICLVILAILVLVDWLRAPKRQ